MINVLIGLGVFALGVIIGVVVTVCVVIGKDGFGDKKVREGVRQRVQRGYGRYS